TSDPNFAPAPAAPHCSVRAPEKRMESGKKKAVAFSCGSAAQRPFSMFVFACSAFLFDAVSGHSPSGKSEGTVSPGTKAHAAQVKGSHANPCKPAWAEKP